jgi:tRNA modification GTPase
VIDNSSKNIEPKIKNLINEDCIIVLNKSDVDSGNNHNFDRLTTVLISVKQNENILQLTNKIKEKLNNKFKTTNNVLVTRERHRNKLNACLIEIENFLTKDQDKDIEMAAEDLRLATRYLGALVGKVDVEEILDSIFKDFCIGK